MGGHPQKNSVHASTTRDSKEKKPCNHLARQQLRRSPRSTVTCGSNRSPVRGFCVGKWCCCPENPRRHPPPTCEPSPGKDYYCLRSTPLLISLCCRGFVVFGEEACPVCVAPSTPSGLVIFVTCT